MVDLPLFSFISVLFTPIFIRSVSYPSGGALARDARMPSLLVLIRRVPCSRDSNIPLTFKTVIRDLTVWLKKRSYCTLF